MKLSVALFFAGLFGALATLAILLSFGTDYWLVAYETCPDPENTGTPVEQGDMVVNQDAADPTVFYHEGFFWLCSFTGRLEASDGENLLKFWFTNQPHSKECKHAYLFPYPVSEASHNATTYDSAIIYRGFWSVFMLVGVAAAVLAGFLLICAAPFSSHCLYKAGGGLYLISALFLLAVTIMFVIWKEALDLVPMYKEYQITKCPLFEMSMDYGFSFMLAPVGVFFCLLAGLLFLLIGRSVQMQCR
ncbi:transmembrane protein 182 [Clupea harengus]|uniref:Transmembrane protein 182 n=1 Tax=Clupea harengus TaxID=7950 RepID=A0A6P3WA20_CLUHA|nr:transmembrane protein 182 [Clupea harengus]